MARDDEIDRRKVLAAGLGLLAAVPPLAALEGKPAGKALDPDEGAPVPSPIALPPSGRGGLC